MSVGSAESHQSSASLGIFARSDAGQASQGVLGCRATPSNSAGAWVSGVRGVCALVRKMLVAPAHQVVRLRAASPPMPTAAIRSGSSSKGSRVS